jgi:hypothetical protein
MKNRAALLQLARMIGVEARYTDALGETREVSDDTLLALIAAFGLPPDPVRASAARSVKSPIPQFRSLRRPYSWQLSPQLRARGPSPAGR